MQIMTRKEYKLFIDKLVQLPTQTAEPDVEGIIKLARSRLRKRAQQRTHAKDKGKHFPSYRAGQ